MPYDANHHHFLPIDSGFFALIFVDAPLGAQVDAVANKKFVARYKYLEGGAASVPAAATASEVSAQASSLPPIYQETVTISKLDIFYTTLTTQVNAATMTPGVSFF